MRLPQAALLLAAFGIAAGPGTPPTAAMHPFHMSIAEAEYNSATKSLEIGLQLHPEDLEAVLRGAEGQPVSLGESTDVDERIRAYLQQRFSVTRADGTRVSLEWVGKEVSDQWVWLYFEVALPHGLAGVQFRHEVLFDRFNDQVNTIHFKIDEGRRSFTFYPARPQRTF